MLDWSWEQLDDAQQTLLARLSVFSGGWTLDAADSVCGEGGPIDSVLAGLIDHGLARHILNNNVSRYEMPDLVRVFAADRLADRASTDVFVDRMVNWLTDVAARWAIRTPSSARSS